MSLRRKLWLGLAATPLLLILALVAASVWILPEMVRHEVVSQIGRTTGRAVSLDAVTLNVLAGRVALKGFRLGERDGSEALVEFERLDVGVALAPLLQRHVRLTEITLTAPTVRVVRMGPHEFNFSDLLALVPPADAPRASRWTVTVDRVGVLRGALVAQDRTTSPAGEWHLTGLTVGAGGLSSRRDEAPGQVAMQAKLGDTSLAVDTESIRVGPGLITARLSLEGLELAQLHAFLPADLPAVPDKGKVGLTLVIAVDRTPEGGVKRAVLSGNVRVDGLALTRREAPGPFATVAHVSIGLKAVDLLARTMALEEVELDGVDLRARRDANGRIDLLTMVSDREGAAAPATAHTVSRRPDPEASVAVERVLLKNGTVTVTDEAISPARVWRVHELLVDAKGLSTSDRTVGRLDVRGRVVADRDTGSAGGGSATVALTAESVRLSPLSASVQASVESLDLGQLGPYVTPGLPILPPAGSVTARMTLDIEAGPEGLRRALVSGDVRVNGLTLTRPGNDAPFAAIPELAVVVRRADLVSRTAMLGRIDAAEGWTLDLRRDGSGMIDLLSGLPQKREPVTARRAPTASPATAADQAFQISVERVALAPGAVKLTDEAVSPSREWRLEGLAVDAEKLASAPGQIGRVEIRGRVAALGSAAAALAVEADSVRISPIAASARVSLEGFELNQLAPYLPAGLPIEPPSGKADLRVRLALEGARDGLARALASGEAKVSGLTLVQLGRPAPFAAAPHLSVSLKALDLVGRTATLGSVEVAAGWSLRAVRDAAGRIDLLALAGPRRSAPASTGATSPSRSAAAGEWRVKLERLALGKGTAAFEDQAVSPRTSLTLDDLALVLDGAAWPSTAPGPIEITTGLPGGGRMEIKGSARLSPLEADVYMSMRDAPIAPYQAYLPFKARIVGRFSGDSRSQVKVENGQVFAASQGTGWTRDLEIRAPDGSTPVIRVERTEFRSVDFGWPHYARVARVTLTRPSARVERASDGTIDLRSLFAIEPSRPASDAAPKSADRAGSAASRRDGGGLTEALLIDVGELVIEDGAARFLDRTTRPASSQDFSRLTARVREISNTPGQRGRLTAKGVIGGDATFTLNGQISPLGDEFYADLVSEVKSFPLPSINPYVEARLGWFVRRGRLDARAHYRVDGDRLTGTMEGVVSNLDVTPASAAAPVDHRLGLPLDTAVSLMKDRRGEIRVSVPVYGTLRERHFDWSDVIWTGVQNSLVNIVSAPFKLVGRLFARDDGAEASVVIAPVSFAPGSAVIAPGMEDELLRAADFLRGSPGAGLSLAAVATGRDVEALKGEAVSARIQRLQRERGLPDFAAALRVYFTERLPDVTRPETDDDRLAALRAREPVPEARVAELLARRVEVTRDALIRGEGVEPERLVAGAASTAADAPGDGVVEFRVIAE